MDKKNLLLLINRKKDLDLSISKELLSFLSNLKYKVYVEKGFEKELNCQSYNNEEVLFAIVLGGDGTILSFSKKYDIIPLLGINLGRVGCLTVCNINEYKDVLLELLTSNKEIIIQKSNVIKCKIFNNDDLKNPLLDVDAFNEIYIHRGSSPKMLLLNLSSIDEISSNMTPFYADGLIVSTASGSSAYNLSCGGPLLSPSTHAFVYTPIAPQSRSLTSLVLNDTDTTTISFNYNFKDDTLINNTQLFVDGIPLLELDNKKIIQISKSSKTLKIVKAKTQQNLFSPIIKVNSSTDDLINKIK